MARETDNFVSRSLAAALTACENADPQTDRAQRVYAGVRAMDEEIPVVSLSAVLSRVASASEIAPVTRIRPEGVVFAFTPTEAVESSPAQMVKLFAATAIAPDTAASLTHAVYDPPHESNTRTPFHWLHRATASSEKAKATRVLAASGDGSTIATAELACRLVAWQATDGLSTHSQRMPEAITYDGRVVGFCMPLTELPVYALDANITLASRGWKLYNGLGATAHFVEAVNHDTALARVGLAPAARNSDEARGQLLVTAQHFVACAQITCMG